MPNIPHQQMLKFATSLLAIFIMSACTSSGPITYSSVLDLKSAFIDAGGDCSDWAQRDEAGLDALESGDCNSTNVLTIYEDEVTAAKAAKRTANVLRSFDLVPHIAYGANWVVNGDEAADIGVKLGGTLIDK